MGTGDLGTRDRAVVLGGNGFIGSACVRALLEAGYSVTALGRSVKGDISALPGVLWQQVDIGKLSVQDWRHLLDGADVVVNAAGALQDGARDNLEAIHVDAVVRLVTAMQGGTARLIQISAAGVCEDAPSWFMRSKWLGDQAVTGSQLRWWVLRPVLVFGSQAHGGTALLRASAAMPGVGLIAFADAPVQTIHVDDVARAVVQCARGEIAPAAVVDLTEPGRHSFADLMGMVRRWLGYSPWTLQVNVPAAGVFLAGRVADLLGWLGWRSPLRTSALVSLRAGVTGDPEPWRAAGGRDCRALNETLAAIPVGQQERWFARIYLLLPLAIAVLAVFWFSSGAVGLWQSEAAIALLTQRGFADMPASVAVYAGSLVDIALGAMVLVRRWTRRAVLGMVAASLGYLAAAAIWTPDLWVDPLGPMVKVVPSMVLALFVAALMEER